MPTPSYRDQVRPALIDTAIPTNGSADAAQQLANVFKQFERTGLNVLGDIASDQGRRQGAEAGRTDHPGFRTGAAAATAHGRAYNDAATRSYAIKSEIAADEAAARLENEAGNDPERFRLSFGARRDAVLAEAPEEARPLLAEAYDRRMAQGVKRLSMVQAAEIREADRADLAEGVTRSTDRFAELMASDDPALRPQAEEEQVKIDMLIESGLQDGTLSVTEAGALRIESARQSTKKIAQARLAKEIANPYGDPVGYIQRVQEANKTSEALPPEEEDKLVGTLLEDLRQHNSLMSMRDRDSDNAQKQRWAVGDRVATNMMLEGRLTSGTLSSMIEDDELDPSVARTLYNELQSGNDRPDDTRERFRVETTLLDQTEDEIAKNSKLSWATRRELTLKRREQLNGWRGTQQAREATERIDRSLGILPNVAKQAQDDAFLQKRERALTEWYNRVDALPPADRQTKMIPLAEEVINTVIRTEAQAEAAELRATISSMRIEMDSGKYDEQEMKDFERKIAPFEARLREAEAKAK